AGPARPAAPRPQELLARAVPGAAGATGPGTGTAASGTGVTGAGTGAAGVRTGPAACRAATARRGDAGRGWRSVRPSLPTAARLEKTPSAPLTRLGLAGAFPVGSEGLGGRHG